MQPILNGKNAVFLGETGSGKTELAVNWAMRLACGGEPVHFFDMDQTKPLFRARDITSQLEATGVHMAPVFSFMDAPVIPAGVTGYLNDLNARCVFDVGGNTAGAKMIGQFSHLLNGQETDFCYVINPARPFSYSLEDIRDTMARILPAGGIEKVLFVSNPCMGKDTSLDYILEQHAWLTKTLGLMGQRAAFLAIDSRLENEARALAGCPVFPIRLYIKNLYDF